MDVAIRRKLLAALGEHDFSRSISPGDVRSEVYVAADVGATLSGRDSYCT